MYFSKMCIPRCNPPRYTAVILLAVASLLSFQVDAKNVHYKNAWGSQATAQASGLGRQEGHLISALKPRGQHKREIRSSAFTSGSDDLTSNDYDSGIMDGGLGGFLQIKEAPPKLLEAREHGKTVLECSAAGSPAPRVTWYKDGRPLVKDYSTSMLRNIDQRDLGLEDALGETISHLTIDCVSENDAGYYECVAQNSKGQTTVTTEVRVASFGASTGCSSKALGELNHTPPKIHQWIATYIQTMGSSAMLLCNSQGKHKTEWFSPNDQPIVNSQKYKILPTGDLIVKDLSFDDMGMFRCMVSNEFGHDMKETFVYPLAPMK